MRKNNMVLGVILLGLGAVALLNNFGLINFHFSIWRLWPLIFLIPGLVFELNYFNNNGPVGLVVPGGILLTYGAIFMICSIFGYQHMIYLWPWTVGSVGIGLYQLYLFGERHRPLFWVSFGFITFAVLSSSLALLSIKGSYVFPALLIVAGVALLYNSKGHSDDDSPIISVEYENSNEE